MPNRLFSFSRSALLAGMSAVLAALSLSARAQTPARTAFDILEVGRWSNPPKKANPLAAHHTYHSAEMNCDVGYSIYLPPNYAAASVRQTRAFMNISCAGCAMRRTILFCHSSIRLDDKNRVRLFTC
jgi:hypothetical protein